ncbi:MAG: DUF1513 domain-containing protein, partial [Granulosicoccus sp.]
MATNRRQFVQWLFACPALPTFSPLVCASVADGQMLASAYRSRKDELYGLAIFDSAGKVLSRTPLPERGHASVFHPDNKQLVVFARRPGRHMHIFNTIGDFPTIEIDSIPGRHFYGHGCFDKSGTLLYATENAYNEARGVIGIYDVRKGYQRVGEFSTYGTGPHDVALHTDGQTLVVANGGIETHPATGSEKLNLLDMRSSLVFIDTRTGTLVERFQLPDEYRQLSLRHLSIGTNGDCHFGGQYQGAPEDLPPLAGSLTANGKIDLWSASVTIIASLKNYISSVCAVPNSTLVAVSSSRGGVTLIWDSRQGKVLQVIAAL